MACDAADDEHGRGGVEEGGGGFDGGFEVLCEASVAVDPGKEALDHPSAGQDDEPDLIGLLSDDFDEDIGGCGDALMVVASIGPDVLDKGEQGARDLEERSASVTILNVGGMRFDEKWPSVGIDQRVALASVDLFAGIIAARAAGFGGLNALAVDDGSRGLASRPTRSRSAGDCREFRVWAGIMGRKESRYVPRQRACDTE